VLKTAASAWQTGVLWGAPAAPDGGAVVWGTRCAAPECDDELWQSVEPDKGEGDAVDEEAAGALMYPDADTGSGSNMAAHHSRPGADAGRNYAAVLPDRFRLTRPLAGAAVA
jgi:hypothetical protein